MGKRMIGIMTVGLSICMAAGAAGCGNGKTDAPEKQTAETVSSEAAQDVSRAESSAASTESQPKTYENTNNLNFMISGDHEGDNDGPAYVIYSNKGMNKGSIDVRISKVKLNLKRKKDGLGMNSYAFLGIDVYNTTGSKDWANCADTGFVNCGDTPGWHLFCNRYSCTDGDSWYESKVILDDTHDYREVLDSSKKNDRFDVYIYDTTDGDKLVDKASFDLPGTLADGSNTAYYQDYALDYPDDVKYDTNGDPSENDWPEITAYNTDQGIYMDNLTVDSAKLWENGKETDWTSDKTADRYMWPNLVHPGPDYVCTQLEKAEKDTSLVLNLDLNRGRLKQ